MSKLYLFLQVYGQYVDGWVLSFVFSDIRTYSITRCWHHLYFIKCRILYPIFCWPCYLYCFSLSQSIRMAI